MRKQEALMVLQSICDAVEWLDGLTETASTDMPSPTRQSVRVFTEKESDYFPLACRRFLLSMEQQGVLDAVLRERVIHHALALQIRDMNLSVIHGITRVILSQDPKGEQALARMDLLIADLEHHTIQ